MISEVRTVIVYGEFLFIENFITGALLLVMTGMLLGEKLRKLRIMLGALICGMSGFTLFIAVSGVAAVAVRVLIAVAVVSAVFGIGSLKTLARRTVIFVALTLLSGGAVMALMLWQNVPALSGCGVFYIQPITYIRLICFGMIAFGFAYHTVRIIGKIRMQRELCGIVRISIGGEMLEFSAMIDTGNYLREPVGGRPVALIGKNAAVKLQKFARRERYVLIPFSSAGVKNGILEGIRSDCLYFRGNEVRSAVIAFYDGDFEDSDLILGRDFLNGGISNEESEEYDDSAERSMYDSVRSG